MNARATNGRRPLVDAGMRGESLEPPDHWRRSYHYAQLEPLALSRERIAKTGGSEGRELPIATRITKTGLKNVSGCVKAQTTAQGRMRQLWKATTV